MHGLFSRAHPRSRLSQSWGRNSSLSLCCCSSPQNLCAFLCCALSQIRQRRFVLPYVDAVISTTCCCMLHSLKKIPPSLTLCLCVSLLISYFPLLFFVFGQSIPCICLCCGCWIKLETWAVIGDGSAGSLPRFPLFPVRCALTQAFNPRERDVGKTLQ